MGEDFFPGDGEARGIALDGDGNVYVTGRSPAFGSYGGASLAKFDAAGERLQTVTLPGSTSSLVRLGLCIAVRNGMVVVGSQNDGGVDQTLHAYDTNLSHLWSKGINYGSSYRNVLGVCISAAGDIYCVTGQRTHRFDSAGNQVAYSDFGTTVAVCICEDDTNVWIGGDFSQLFFPSIGVYQLDMNVNFVDRIETNCQRVQGIAVRDGVLVTAADRTGPFGSPSNHCNLQAWDTATLGNIWSADAYTHLRGVAIGPAGDVYTAGRSVSPASAGVFSTIKIWNSAGELQHCMAHRTDAENTAYGVATDGTSLYTAGTAFASAGGGETSCETDGTCTP